VVDAVIVTLQVLVMIAMTFVIAQALAAWSRLRRRRSSFLLDARREPGDTPPVTILKPIAGLDDGLRANLESFMGLDYPEYEVIFCLQDPEDRALGIVTDVHRRHPRRTRVLVGDYRGGFNPKVSNLIPGYDAAAHDLILISDANVRVRPQYLREAVSHMADPGVGLVHHLVRGTGGVTLGATLDNGYVNTFLVGAVALFDRLGISCVVGKSMLMRKSDLEKFGGLRAVEDYLAEDFALAARLELAGLRTVVSSSLVDRVAIRTGVREFVARYSRWGTLRHSISGPAYALEPLTNPVPLALTLGVVAVATGRGIGDPALVLALAAVAVKAAVDVAMTAMLGQRVHVRDAWAGPMRDLLMLLAWLAGYRTRTVMWRDKRLLVTRGSRLEAAGTGTPRVALTGPRSLPGLRRVARGRPPAAG
jgi:ceramide glucosyltransferase